MSGFKRFLLAALRILALYSLLAGIGASVAAALGLIFCYWVARGEGVPIELIPGILGWGIAVAFCVSIFSLILERRLRRIFFVDSEDRPSL